MINRATLSAVIVGNAADAPNSRSARLRRTFWMSTGLVYMAPLVTEILHRPAGQAALGVAGLVAFVTSYLTTLWLRPMWLEGLDRRTWVSFAVFTALSCLLPYVLGAEWAGLAIYLSIVSAVVLPMKWALWGVAAATGVMFVHLTTVADHHVSGTLILTTFTLGIMMLSFRNARVLVIQLQEARGEVARLAATEERLRIARDLHDLLGHSLSLIVLKSELAKRMSDRDHARAMQEIIDIEAVARQALADVREAVSAYRRRDLDEELDGARSALSAAGVRATVRASGTPLPETVDGLFGWAVREGVTNVVRHANATTCEISIGHESGAAVLRVTDDGTGTGTGDGTGITAGPGSGSGPGSASGSVSGGNGLTGLAERIATVGGTLSAGPLPGGGFRLTVRAPLDVAVPDASPLSSQT